MSSSDGQPSKPLTDALDQIFSGGQADSEPADGITARDGAAPPRSGSDGADEGVADDGVGAAGDATPDEPYELPQIVPATTDARVERDPSPTAPSLPTTRSSSPPSATAPATVPQARAAAPAPAPAASGATAAPAARSTGWTDHMTTVPVGARTGQLRAPGRRPRVRRVTRVLRHIDPWSTFKVGLLFSLVTYIVLLTSGVLLWRVADSTGTLDNVERWFTQFGWETFELKGGEIFHNAWIIGLFGAVGMTGGLVLFATLFNLVSDIIGGIRVTVLEEEVVERTITSTRRYVVRQGRAADPAMQSQNWDIDGDDDEPAPPPATSPNPAGPPAADWSVDD